METPSEVLGKAPKNISDEWIKESTKESIKLKKELRETLGPSSILYKCHKANVKKLCKIDKEDYEEKKYKELDRYRLDQKYYKVMKTLKEEQKKKIKTCSIKSKEGRHIIDRLEIIERWSEFYEDLYSATNNDHQLLPPDLENHILEILEEEVEKAINKLNDNKSPGPDGLCAEMLKEGGTVLTKALHKLCNLMLYAETLPDEIKQSEIVTIYKKGDRSDCSNYRPISLLSHIYKVFTIIIYNRIASTLADALPRTQAAYQKGRGTTEQIMCLQQIIEKYNEFNINGVICFIDFKKAFDSVDQVKLWQALESDTELNRNYINILIKLYAGSKAQVRTDFGLTRLFQLLKGVRQGDILSALLFCVALMVIMKRTLQDSSVGIKVGGEV